MGTSDYQMGYQAYLNKEPFDETRSAGWQEGWEDAEYDDYDANAPDYEFFGD